MAQIWDPLVDFLSTNNVGGISFGLIALAAGLMYFFNWPKGVKATIGGLVGKIPFVGKRKDMVVAVFVILALMGGAVGDASGMFAGIFGTAAGVSEEEGGAIIDCDGSITPDVNIVTYDAFNEGTAIAEGESVYRRVGHKLWTQFTTGTSIDDLVPGATYEYFVGTDTTDFTDNAFGKYGTFTVRCVSDDRVEFAIFNDEVEGSLTAEHYDKTKAGTGAQAITAGDTMTNYLYWKTGVDEVFGNPFIQQSGLGDNGNHRAILPNLLQIKLNSTDFTEAPVSVSVSDYSLPTPAATLGFANVAGQTLNQVSCPAAITATTGFTNYCYEAPIIWQTDTYIKVDLKAAVTTTIDATAYLYSSHIYVNSDTGELEWGSFNEDSAYVGADAADSLTIDLTA